MALKTNLPKLVEDPELASEANHQPANAAEAVLKPEEAAVYDFLIRASFIGRVAAELRRRAESSGLIFFNNDLIYNMVGSSYDMLVTDFASWCKRAVARGGFFGQIQNHLRKLRRANPKHMRPSEPIVCPTSGSTPKIEQMVARTISENQKNRQANYINEQFDFLFPTVKERAEWQAQPQDIEKLKRRFVEMAEAVIGDRDNWRAHRYDGEKDPKYQRLPLRTIRKKVRETIKMMQAFRIVLTNGEAKMYNQPNSNLRRSAQDIADLIIHGGIPQVMSRFRMFSTEKAAIAVGQYDEARQTFYRKNRMPK